MTYDWDKIENEIKELSTDHLRVLYWQVYQKIYLEDDGTVDDCAFLDTVENELLSRGWHPKMDVPPKFMDN